MANPLISEKVNLEEERRRKNKLGHLFPPLSKFAGRAGWGKSLPRSGKFFRWSKRWHEKGKRRGESWLGRGGSEEERRAIIVLFVLVHAWKDLRRSNQPRCLSSFGPISYLETGNHAMDEERGKKHDPKCTTKHSNSERSRYPI